MSLPHRKRERMRQDQSGTAAVIRRGLPGGRTARSVRR
jgi:hypothetical protein